MFKKLKRIFYRSCGNDINYKTAIEMNLQENAILLDVRSAQEYKEGHLPYSICISVYDLKNKVEKQIPNKKQIIIVYCSSGNRSKQAQKILEKIGYEEVYNLKGRTK